MKYVLDKSDSQIPKNTTHLFVKCEYDLDVICNLVNLTHLELVNYYLQSLPDNIDKLVNLEYFDCSDNNLSYLPDTICNLINLKELKCNKNNLQSLPENLGKLVNLNTLECCCNNLTYLPDSIGDIVELIHLIFTYNKLSVIPESFTNIREMNVFCCDNNNLTYLPILKTKYVLSFYNNPMFDEFYNLYYESDSDMFDRAYDIIDYQHMNYHGLRTIIAGTNSNCDIIEKLKECNLMRYYNTFILK
jgi:Leucine-rich repeat (LRR) protein